MAFSFQQPPQPPQPPPNLPPNQRPMFPGSFNHQPEVFNDGPGNLMMPARGVPKNNSIQNMLGRFFPTGGMQQAATLPAQAASGAGATGGGLTNTLNNVQQILKVVQQTAPVVKEYGPMVKNIPSMIRMMKAFNDFNDEEPESNTTEKNVGQSEEQPEKMTQTGSTGVTNQPETTQQSSAQTEKRTTIQEGESKPMLFI